MTDDPAAARTRLGLAVAARRKSLGLSQTRAAELAGISRTTWKAVEDGNRETEEYIYGSVERAIGWTTGSAESVLEGGQPTEQKETPTKRPGSPAREPMHPSAVRILAALADPDLPEQDHEFLERQLRLLADSATKTIDEVRRSRRAS